MRRAATAWCAGTGSLINAVAALAHGRNVTSMVVGQPTHATHPELLGPGELQPGVTADDFRKRRGALSSLLPPGALAIIPAAPTIYMTGIIPFPFRQDADFLWLTGITQQAVAVIQASPNRGSTEHTFTLFVPPNDASQVRWDGAFIDLEAAKEVFGADQAAHTTELPALLGPLAAQAPFVIADWDRPHAVLRQQLGSLLRPVAERGKLMMLRHFMDRLRWRKSEAEVALMRRAAQLAVGGLRKCMGMSRPGLHEAQLAAAFEYHCKSGGAARMSYPSVVAGGPDACTVHYQRNDKHVREGELVLMDAGCELHGYASDVTRTWPVSGRFSGPQLDVYDAVLEAHSVCRQACKPGVTLSALHALSVEVLATGLKDLRVIPGKSKEEIIRDGLYKNFYCHSVGHWLGLDTHDTPTVPHQQPLQPGVVLTLEPGLYIPNDERHGPFRGIGVRIEDDVLVTDQGCEVLSAGLPTKAEEVEELVGAARAAAATKPASTR